MKNVEGEEEEEGVEKEEGVEEEEKEEEQRWVRKGYLMSNKMG